jgi:hypothetical protein
MAPPPDPSVRRNAMLSSLELPPDWISGLLMLSGRVPPHRFLEDQAGWARIIEDAGYLARCWGREAAAAGWSHLDLFGCSPGCARRLDRDGLAMLLQGRLINSLASREAVVANPAGPPHVYRRKNMAESVPLWLA